MSISHVIYLEFARLIVSWQWVTEVYGLHSSGVQFCVVYGWQSSRVHFVRSLQCPPNSCRNPVIPAESIGFQRNELWQEALPFSSFQCLIILAEFGHSGIETGMFCGFVDYT